MLSNTAAERCEKNTLEGFHNVLKAYHSLLESSSKAEGDQRWAELTRNVTLFRRTISRMESQAYEVISHRFASMLPTEVAAVAAAKKNDDGWGTPMKKVEEPRVSIWNQPRAQHNNAYTKPAPKKVLSITPPPPPPSPKVVEVAKEEVKVEPTIIEVKVEPTKTEPVAEQQKTPQKAFVGPKPFTEEELKEDWAKVIGDVTTRMPLGIPFRASAEFLARVLFVVSPLEFYVIKSTHLSNLEEVERVIGASDERLCRQRLPTDVCVTETACLARVGDHLNRAVIRMAGAKEVQLFLVDYGRTHFVDRENLFSLPRCIANMAPPLAHYCSLTDADSRKLDNAAVNAFHRKIVGAVEVLIRATGDSRRSHGQLVELLEKSTTQLMTSEATPTGSHRSETTMSIFGKPALGAAVEEVLEPWNCEAVIRVEMSSFMEPEMPPLPDTPTKQTTSTDSQALTCSPSGSLSPPPKNDYGINDNKNNTDRWWNKRTGLVA